MTSTSRRIATWVGAAIVAWVAASAVLPHGAPVGVVATGIVLGSVTAVTAMGLILIYRATRVVNFSYIAMGGVGGVLGVQLYLKAHWPWLAAVLAGVAVSTVTGALIDVLVIRRLARSSRVIVTVATVGLAQLLAGVELLTPELFGAKSFVVGSFATPPDIRLHLQPVVLTGSHVLVMASVPVVLGGLAWFLLRSRLGVAVRAVAENPERGRLLGIPVRRLSTLVWALAGGLSALSFLLRAPFQGVTPDVIIGPGLLLGALAAAVVARMESLPAALVAGLGLGVVEQLVLWSSDTPALTDVAFLAVILIALVVRGAPQHVRTDEGTTSPWSTPGVIRSAGRDVRRDPWYGRARLGIGLAAVAVAAAAPIAFGPSAVNLMSVAVVWCAVAVSLTLLTGWAGHISLGQFALVGCGAVVAGNLVEHTRLDLFVALLLGGAAAGLVAIVLGLPAFRIGGPFLAVTTLAFAVAFDSYFLNPTYFSGWIPQTIAARPVLWQRFPLEHEAAMYELCLGFLVLTVLAAASLRTTRAGRVAIAVRDNRRTAETMGVPSTRVKLWVFGLSGVVAGMAGALHVVLLHGARLGSYQPAQSLEVFSLAVIGGVTSVGGVLLGVVTFRLIGGVAPAYRLVFTGTGLLVVLLVAPGGLAEAAARTRDWAMRLWLSRRTADAVPKDQLATAPR